MSLILRELTLKVGERCLFRDLSLDLKPAEITLLRGPSGAGKTLLLRAIAGLDPCDAAEISLDGRSQTEWSLPGWRMEVAYVRQRPAALSGTPRQYAESVAQLKAQRGREHDDPLELAKDWMLPAGAWDQPWANLSGGEAQRAALAVLVARRPRVLLLDEPTAALDAEAAAAVEASLRGKCALWVTHSDEQAQRLADSTIDLETWK